MKHFDDHTSKLELQKSMQWLLETFPHTSCFLVLSFMFLCLCSVFPESIFSTINMANVLLKTKLCNICISTDSMFIMECCIVFILQRERGVRKKSGMPPCEASFTWCLCGCFLKIILNLYINGLIERNKKHALLSEFCV